MKLTWIYDGTRYPVWRYYWLFGKRWVRIPGFVAERHWRKGHG